MFQQGSMALHMCLTCIQMCIRSCCRMKGQMLSRVNQVAAAFRKVSHQEMAETTKRTIRENVAIASQLGKMSDRTMEIGKETMDLKDQVSAGRQQILAMEAMETGLTRNYISSRKVCV